jgi:hypothetical protein
MTDECVRWIQYFSYWQNFAKFQPEKYDYQGFFIQKNGKKLPDFQGKTLKSSYLYDK